MGTTPLKLEGSSGDLKEMTTAEENYLAHEVGSYLADLTTTGVAMLTTTSGGTSIGSYSNTFYNQAVGTHPGTSLSIGTTTTTVYQNSTPVAETGIVRPLQWDGTLTGVQQMDDTDWNTGIDRLLTTIFTNEYPGVIRLASASPGATWTVHQAAVFTDTQTSGTVATYNLYQNGSATPPAAVYPMKIESTSPIALKQMTAAEVKANFGKRAANRIMSSSNHIGAYQLRSSANGAPVAAGTWVARGTATDTRKTTADVDYTRNSTVDYTRNSTSDFTRNSTSNFTTNFTRNSTSDFTRNSTTIFTGDFAGNFAGNFTGDFIGNTNFTRISIRISTRASYRTCRSPNSQGDPILLAGNPFGLTEAPSYSGGVTNYLGTFIGNFVGNFFGDFVGTRNYTRISARTSTRNSAVAFTGDFAGNFIGDFTGDFIGDFIGDFAGNFIGDFAGNFIGDFVGNYLGETIQSASTTVETYTLYVRIS